MLSYLKQTAQATFRNFSSDGATVWAAALAFYMMLSAGPLLFVAVALAGMVVGRDVAQAALLAQAGQLMGPEAARAVQQMVEASGQPAGHGVGAAVGVLTLLYGASGVFSALQDAMDAIWHVRPKEHAGIGGWLRRRFFSASMVFGLGMMLVVTLLLNTMLDLAWEQAGEAGSFAIVVAEQLSAWVTGTALLVGIYRILPDATLNMRDTLIGAALTALLLNGGKSLIGTYLGASGVTTPFGAAGSLALVLLWVYYAAQMLFLGASLTRVLSEQRGEGVRPDHHAVAVETVEQDTAS